jgi:hypothetical protein
MPTTIVPPDLRRILGGLERRLAILERRIRGGGTDGDDNIFFSMPGEIEALESPPIYLRHGGYVESMRVTLGTAGTTTTTVTLNKDGTTVATANLGTGITTVHIGVRVRYGADSETMTVEVTAVGTGAADLTAEVRY